MLTVFGAASNQSMLQGQKSLSFKQGVLLCRYLAENYGRLVTDLPLNTSIPAYFSSHRWLLPPLRDRPKAAAGISSESSLADLAMLTAMQGSFLSKQRGMTTSHRYFPSRCSIHWCILCFRYRQGPGYLTLLQLLALTRSSCCSKHILHQSTP